MVGQQIILGNLIKGSKGKGVWVCVLRADCVRGLDKDWEGKRLRQI